MSLVIDYSRYQTLRITRRGANQTVLDIQMKAGGPGGNGKLPTAGHEGHAELAEIWRDVSRDDSVRAGSIVGSGTVSNKSVDVNGKPEWPKGYSCIAEKRAIETILDGKPSTEFMKYGDTIRIEMKGLNGESLFGAIEQEVVPLER